MEKNEVYTGVCTGYNEMGSGVVRIDGIVFFVPGLIIGEEAEIGIVKMKKNYGYGRVVRITKPSEHRVTPSCSVSKVCGGCVLQHMDYEAQLDFKYRKVQDCFHNIENVNLLKPLSTEHMTRYRNKVQVPVQFDKGEVLMGFYQNHTNRIIPYEDCILQTELSNEMTDCFRKWFRQLRCTNYIRHVLIKHAHNTGEVMVCLVVRQYPFDGSEELKDRILKKFPAVKSLSVMINRREDNVILDGKEVLLAGKPYIEEVLLGKRFRISARSFFQVNPYATEILYGKALEYAGLTGKEILIDLYCGTGTIGILASDKCKKVYGIEIVPEAIKDAKENMKLNGIENIDFLNMDAEKGAAAVVRSKIKADVVIVDPPRKGCSRDTLTAIEKIAPKRLVYVSCDPATLARDVEILLNETDYQLIKVQPVDLFPNTHHIETVVLLSKQNSSKYTIDVDAKEYYDIIDSKKENKK